MIEKFPQIIFNFTRLTMKEMLTMTIFARWCEACLVVFVGLGKILIKKVKFNLFIFNLLF